MAEIVAVWPQLPEHIKQAIKALVKTVMEPNKDDENYKAAQTCFTMTRPWELLAKAMFIAAKWGFLKNVTVVPRKYENFDKMLQKREKFIDIMDFAC